MEKYISIIVPIYKVEMYLRECINSLLNQNLSEEQYEILLIDDGSPDCCGDICDEYEKQYKNIFSFHKKNGGLSDARNYGMKYARGKYVLFVDADDFIEPNSLRKIVLNCKKQKEPEIFFLKAEKVYDGSRREKYDSDMDISELVKGKEESLNYISKRKMYPTSAWSKMVKKELLEQNKIEFIPGQLSEDYIWSMKVYLCADTFGCYNGKYYCYRQSREGSISSFVSKKHLKDLIEIIEDMEKEANRNKKNEAFILSCAAYVYKIFLWSINGEYTIYRDFINQRKYLLNKRKNSDLYLINTCSKLFGLKNTINLLKLYRKLKNRSR